MVRLRLRFEIKPKCVIICCVLSRFINKYTTENEQNFEFFYHIQPKTPRVLDAKTYTLSIMTVSYNGMTKELSYSSNTRTE
jgi:hypothetical protein